MNSENPVELSTRAEQAVERSQQRRTLLLAGGAVVPLLPLIGGDSLYTQSSGDDYSKL